MAESNVSGAFLSSISSRSRVIGFTHDTVTTVGVCLCGYVNNYIYWFMLKNSVVTVCLQTYKSSPCKNEEHANDPQK